VGEKFGHGAAVQLKRLTRGPTPGRYADLLADHCIGSFLLLFVL